MATVVGFLMVVKRALRSAVRQSHSSAHRGPIGKGVGLWLGVQTFITSVSPPGWCRPRD